MSWHRILLAALYITPLAVATVRVATAPSERAERRADAVTVARIARAVSDAEPGLREMTLRRFPGDRWSQSDDFHNGEHRLARTLAEGHGLAVSEVFAIIDADIRSRRLPLRESGAAPCKPRPHYD